MYRRISVHLDHGFDCPRRTRVALALAKRHQAELVGIYASSAPPQYYYGESVLLSRTLSVIRDLQTQNRPSGATHPGRLRTQGRGFPQRPMMTVRSDDDGAFER